MAKTYNRLEIDVNKKPNSIGIRPVRGDTQSRYLDVSLYENGAAIDLTGEQVRIHFEKADGTVLFSQGEVTDAAAGRCQFALTNAVLSEAGVVRVQISVWDKGGEILSTELFTMLVTESIRNDAAVESENEFGVLVVLFQEIQNALDLMQHIADTFGEPGGKAAEYGVDSFWGILEELAGRADVDAVLRKHIKAALNGTLGMGYQESLDQLLGAKIVCRGYVGTQFILTRTDGYYPAKTFAITENSKAKNGVPFEIVPVPVGIYNLKVTYEGISTDVTVNASALGATYVPAYNLTVVLAEYTSPGTYTFTKPSDLLSNTVYITACGGGAGGKEGGPTDSGGGGGTGGAGGGAAASISKKEYSFENITSLNITVGAGGRGGYYSNYKLNSAVAGGSTIIGNLITLAGGAVGGGFSGGAGGPYTAGKKSSARAGGKGGGTNGGSGGSIGVDSTEYWHSGSGGGGQGSDSLLGTGGSGGKGADGGSFASGNPGGNGGRGAGGGGGGGGSIAGGNAAGDGGNGYVKIEMILSVK